MNDKHLDIMHYLANAIISDPSILGDANYLESIPDRIGISGLERRNFKLVVAQAIKAAAPVTDFSPDAFTERLLKAKSNHARHLASAMMWAIRNKKMMKRNEDRRTTSPDIEVSTAENTEDASLDAFLG